MSVPTFKNGVVNTDKDFDSLIDKECGTRRKCNETPERNRIKEAFMARLQAYQEAQAKETFIGPLPEGFPLEFEEDSTLRLKMREDENYRIWWYEMKETKPNPGILFKYENILQNGYGKIAPKSHHTLPFWRPQAQPAVRK